MITQESLFIADGDHKLHLRHIFNNRQPKREPVLMVHGAIENGRIFYTEKGKGLGCYLARQGFDVYILDLRGRGMTEPKIKPNDQFGQTDTIVRDLPLFIDYVHSHNPQPMHLIAHSWGGVLLTAMLSRFPELLEKVRSKVFFGTKRRVAVFNSEVLFKIKLMWHFAAPKIARRKGYLPAKDLRFGSDDETIKSHFQGMEWTKTLNWIDPEDGFDYHSACRGLDWRPTCFVAGVNDRALGHPEDVKRFMAEADYGRAEFWLLSKNNGNAKDYDHINMLTDAAAAKDHFPKIVEWMRSQS